jgi:diketogulonate reductase-like aldo/keto reductase
MTDPAATQGFVVQGVRVPAFLYGTAWKEDRTTELVELALAAGFRGLDTANQRKHYHEAGVGAALAASGLARDQVFLQTKFTYQRGQDHRLPYDPQAPLAEQVRQSFDRSLEHLGVASIDSYVLHGPAGDRGWSAGDREVWGAMEALHDAGAVALLGVSNIAAEQLASLCQAARVPPAFVQNRCYARTGWDRELRALCRRHDIVYQGFSLLTANRRELSSAPVEELARRRGLEVSQLVFAFARAVGMLPLTGTSSRRHMDEDLQSLAVALTEDEIDLIERAGAA